MPDDTSLVQTIFDHPDDLTPRLIYADWLEEHGEPERAEFLRLQIELGRLSRDDPQRSDLEARESQLLMQHERAWRDRLGEYGLDYSLYTTRQELRTCVIPCNLLSRVPEWQALVEELPFLRDFRNAEMIVGVLHGLVSVAALHGLDLSRCRLDDAAVEALAASRHIADLVHLDLSFNAISDVGAKALAASPYLSRLKVLNLSFNQIEKAGAQALLRSKKLPSLIELNLRSNRLTPSMEKNLAARMWQRVRG
ncbi:MAG: TIGR02996 domain-containing protein [Planctomycetia bacterium]|nr:TIGR02996 domain-containing protein [Planctomycetia bacterium]